MLHDDPLMVSLDIANFTMKRVLSENGSSMDVTILATLKQLGFEEMNIEKLNVNLIGFNGETSALIGNVVLFVTNNGITFFNTMLAIDALLAYNVILGRPW